MTLSTDFKRKELIEKRVSSGSSSKSLRRSYSANADGVRPWIVALSTNEEHEFDTLEEAQSFLSGVVSKAGIRRIRTAAGAKRYGAPIGTPIVRDSKGNLKALTNRGKVKLGGSGDAKPKTRANGKLTNAAAREQSAEYLRRLSDEDLADFIQSQQRLVRTARSNGPKSLERSMTELLNEARAERKSRKGKPTVGQKIRPDNKRTAEGLNRLMEQGRVTIGPDTAARIKVKPGGGPTKAGRAQATANSRARAAQRPRRRGESRSSTPGASIPKTKNNSVSGGGATVGEMLRPGSKRTAAGLNSLMESGRVRIGPESAKRIGVKPGGGPTAAGRRQATANSRARAAARRNQFPRRRSPQATMGVPWQTVLPKDSVKLPKGAKIRNGSGRGAKYTAVYNPKGERVGLIMLSEDGWIGENGRGGTIGDRNGYKDPQKLVDLMLKRNGLSDNEVWA